MVRKGLVGTIILVGFLGAADDAPPESERFNKVRASGVALGMAPRWRPPVAATGDSGDRPRGRGRPAAGKGKAAADSVEDEPQARGERGDVRGGDGRRGRVWSAGPVRMRRWTGADEGISSLLSLLAELHSSSASLSELEGDHDLESSSASWAQRWRGEGRTSVAGISEWWVVVGFAAGCMMGRWWVAGGDRHGWVWVGCGEVGGLALLKDGEWMSSWGRWGQGEL